MALEVLEKLDTDTAANVLAAAALRVAPNPGVGDQKFEAKYAPQADAVLKEISAKLKASGKNTLHFQSALAAELRRQIEGLLVSEETAKGALTRAGQSGRLSPSLYKVVQPSLFRQRFARLGAKKDDVLATVNRPEDWQHLMTEFAVEDAKTSISLFMRSMRARHHEPYWLLVQTHRR